MTRKILFAFISLGSLCVTGCGGGSSSTSPEPPTIASVNASCTPASIQTGQTSQCSATVTGTGSYNSGVTWLATDGTITTAGVFTPSAAGTAIITATSTQDTKKAGTASIAVVTPTALVITISGLPTGALADVTVTDPSGQQTTITANAIINAIPGTYTITAAVVVAGTSRYFAAQATQTVSVVSGATSTASVIYSTIIPNTTKVLDPAGMSSLTVSPDGSTITISTSSAVASSLAVGDVLACGPATAAPSGLLVKILSVSTSGDTVAASVQQATLTDAIQQGTFQFTETLGPANTKMSIRMKEKPSYTSRARPQLSSGAACAGNANTFPIPVNLQLQGSNAAPAAVTVLSGEADLCPSDKLTFQIQGFRLVSATATVTLGTDLSLTVGDNGGLTVTQNLPEIDGPLNTVVIGDVPIEYQLVFTPFFGLKLSPSANISAYTGLSASSQVTLGVSYANGQWTPIDTATTLAASSNATSVDAALSLNASEGLQAGFLIESIVSPYVSGDGYLQFTASPTANPCWSLDYGYEGNVGVSVKILGNTVASYQSPNLNPYPATPILQATTTCFAPMLNGISPTSALVGSPQLTLALTGSNFVPDSVVSFDGQALDTDFLDPDDLTAVVPASDLAIAGSFPVTVTNPDSPGGTSSPVTFTVTPALAVVGLTFNPSSVAPGGSTTGTVTLNSPAPTGGVMVSLTSSNASALQVPVTVHIQAGLTTATFTATASSSVTAATQVSVSASYNDSSQSATVSITPVTVAISPSSATLATNLTQQFVASVTGTSNTAVNWSVDGIAGGDSSVGSISSAGLYTAPATIPNPSAVTVTAASRADPSASGSATVTIFAGYTATDLGTLGGASSTACGINASGQVVGASATSTGVSHAFLYSGGNMIDLGTLSGDSDSWAFSINDAGQVVGTSGSDADFEGTAGPEPSCELGPEPSPPGYAFLYGSGSMIYFLSAVPGISGSYAFGINDTGQIVGYEYNYSIPQTSPDFPFLYTAGTVADLGALPGASASTYPGYPYSWATSINNSGQVAGISAGLNYEHGFLYTGGGMIDLGTLPGGGGSEAFAINNNGQVVGFSYTSGNGNPHAFLYGGGAMTDLGTLPDNFTSAGLGINDAGQVVGGGDQHAFLYSGGTMVDLNNFVNLPAGVYLAWASAVNNLGQIVANASNGHAYLLTPSK